MQLFFINKKNETEFPQRKVSPHKIKLVKQNMKEICLLCEKSLKRKNNKKPPKTKSNNTCSL